ncbi:unnamed protein product, partial [Sphacelaria rigidula]
MAAVGALPPGGHFSGEKRPSERRPQYRQDPPSSQERSDSAARRSDFSVNSSRSTPQRRASWQSQGSVSGTDGTSIGGAVGNGAERAGGSGHPQASLEERFRAVNIGDENRHWVRLEHFAPSQQQQQQGVPAFALRRAEPVPRVLPEQVPGLREGGSGSGNTSGANGVPARAYRQSTGVATAIEGLWPPVVGVIPPPRTVAAASTTAPPTPTPATVATTAISGVGPAVSASSNDVPSPVARVPPSPTCEGWGEPMLAPPVLSGLSASVSEGDFRRLRGTKEQLREASPRIVNAGLAGSAGNQPSGKSPSRLPPSPSVPRGRPRNENWERSGRALTPPPPPMPPQQHQQQQGAHHVHVRVRPNYAAWDGGAHM